MLATTITVDDTRTGEDARARRVSLGTNGELTMNMTFSQHGLLECLGTADTTTLDALPFGVIGMTTNGTVTSYNTAESRLSGLTPANVVGRHFFSAVAPCTNNFMVAHRFETEATLDDTIDYVFTLRMEPTKVRLRLLKWEGCSQMFLAVDRR
jgi:photoactive yellow protein